eukprot:8218803-Heterocapsa_arctica.AAC.1
MEPVCARSWLNSSRSTPVHDWEDRSERRIKLLEIVQARFPFSEERFQNSRIPMPDPFDRSISKRSWEGLVRQWKSSLKNISLQELIFGEDASQITSATKLGA